MIPDEVITQIRDATDIVAVIGQHVQLKKAGRNWKGLCPFHGEKTPSFNVSPDKGFFHCFGCQKHGDAFSFVMELEGKSFVEAAEQLAARFGIVVPRIEEPPEVRRARGERVAMLDINKVATAFFREMLADKRGEAGRAYLAQRGVTAEIAEKFQLGYAPAEWSALADHLKARHVDMELAVRLGLVAHRQRAGSYYDRNRDRLVCPVIVPGGEVVGFSSRLVGTPPPAEDGSVPPKYINSPESSVYKKSKLLFGLAQAREALATRKRAVLVEGNFDVITLYQAGFTEVVAPLGTALTIEQVNVLKRLTDRIVLLYDGDRAGYKATMHALQMCVEADVEVLVARRPGNAKSGESGSGGLLADGIDPDSLVAGGGGVQLLESIDRAQGGIEFFANEVWGKARGNSDARARALEDAGRLLGKVANQVKRDLLLHTLATALGVDVGVVRNAVSRGASHGPGASSQRSGTSFGPSDRSTPALPVPLPGAERGAPPPPVEEVEVITLLADHPTLIATPEADKAFWLLTDERLRAMYSAARAGQSFLELAPVQLPPPTAEHVLSGKYSEAKDPRRDLINMTTNLEGRSAVANPGMLGKPLEETRQRMIEAQRRGDRDLARRLAQLAEAERKGDRELVARMRAELASIDSLETDTSPRKQDD